MRGLMGTFALMPLADLVEYLVRRRASGSLTCERGAVRKTVFLIDGAAVGASSNDPREYLGQLLMNFGHITEEQLSKAFQTQEETKVRLGKVLTMVGVLAPEVVRDTLAIKIRETLLDAFLWDAGVFRVDEAEPPPPDDLDARVPLADIAREAEFRATAWQAFRARFPTGTAALVVHDGRVPASAAPGTVDGRLLALAREGKSIDEIGLALHATDFHLYQRLYALAGQGALEAAAPPAEPREPTGTWGELPEGELAELARALLHPPRTPVLRVSAHEVALMRLTAVEKYLLGRCDGSRDLRQIVQLAPLGEGEVLRAMRKFETGGIVELR
jgi:hypothetical protein